MNTGQGIRDGLDVRVWLALLTVYLVWGATYLGIRLALEGFPPFLLGAGRYAVAGVALYALLRARGKPAPTPQEWKGAAVAGSLLFAGGNGLVTFAQQWVLSGLASVVLATVPLWAAVFSGLSGRWPGGWERVGLLVGFTGVVLLQWDRDLRSQPFGAAVLLVAAVLWAAGSVWSQRTRLPSGPMGSAAQMLAGAAALLALSVLSGERVAGPLPAGVWAAAAYLTVFGSLLGFSAYAYLLRRVRASLATSYAYVNPLVAVTLGATVLGESISPQGLGGMALILAGVSLVLVGRGESGKLERVLVEVTDGGGGR
ncbi:MAG: drug/metabolite exporter YedA [Armatimonadota bacterium]|nr:drug/metabolite exporter YedA [Armatimonadota bacterium]MDR5696837.1 drug/metabolite exporter YedA [Armatimonadota bacterium]